MINDRLVWFLESNQLITKYQAGFRKNNCTNDHLIRLESFIRDAFVKKEHVVAVFFDLEKAYDTTLQRRYNVVAYNAETVITRLGHGSRFFFPPV